MLVEGSLYGNLDGLSRRIEPSLRSAAARWASPAMKLLRVKFQSCLFLVCLFLACPSLAQVGVRADASRMESRIMALAKYGANPEGGVSRLAFSEADIQAVSTS